MKDRAKISTGPNDRPLNENAKDRPVPRTGLPTAGGSRYLSIAGTGPGIPDEALAPGEELPEPPSEEEVARIERALGLRGEEEDLPLEGQ
ncbi:MAG: hypothetical protein QOH81_149 [Sphingomonadales bacterium]|jgi:hypothetical protein|nr:hypothetical protein [Sphingomonadales bacterium]